MTPVRSTSAPADSLLQRYAESGAYVDCYATDIPASVTHAQFVEAFYTTPLFRIERHLLALFISRPSTDLEAARLARGELSSFAAWRVESRAPDEVLLAAGRTRSWLMVTPSAEGPGHGTRLLFGSAVVPRVSATPGRGGLGAGFRALLGLHRLYSRALLHSAGARLSMQPTRSSFQ
jgi:hypothetical protein